MKTPGILLVDDEPQIRIAARRALRGASVWEASSAREAIALLKQEGQSVDLVVSDLEMPGMNGLDFLQLVRLRHPHIIRVLLTGRATIDLSVRALNEQTAHRFLRKPWNTVDFIGTLQLMLVAHRDAPSVPPVMHCPGCNCPGRVRLEDSACDRSRAQ